MQSNDIGNGRHDNNNNGTNKGDNGVL